MSLSTKTLLHSTISISAQTHQHTQPSSSLSLPLTATARGHFPGGGGRLFATTPGARTRPSLWSSTNTTPASTTRIYSLVPMVIDASSTGERAYDIFSRLLKERIVYINGPIDEYMAQIKVAELLH
ncbi:hypothetical protein Tsubulata_048442 [Turnera subulata]|uniref:ATP-dependent Clp protease proteolytic subunit n=1 Tax=Turnera subulata TaxID=218843 RepID=A0A9Q0FGM0_9ROSI|nr:hypothetical protein Tsubulata_048442 [Turnera subulata]